MPNVCGPCFATCCWKPRTTRSRASSQVAGRCVPFSRMSGCVKRPLAGIPIWNSLKSDFFAFCVVRIYQNQSPRSRVTTLVWLSDVQLGTPFTHPYLLCGNSIKIEYSLVYIEHVH